jgi:hypothetical protein
MLQVEPKRRPTVNEALDNQWLRGKATRSEHLNGSVDSMRVIVNKKKTQAFLNKQALRSRASKPSLVQKYLPKVCYQINSLHICLVKALLKLALETYSRNIYFISSFVD